MDNANNPNGINTNRPCNRNPEANCLSSLTEEMKLNEIMKRCQNTTLQNCIKYVPTVFKDLKIYDHGVDLILPLLISSFCRQKETVLHETMTSMNETKIWRHQDLAIAVVIINLNQSNGIIPINASRVRLISNNYTVHKKHFVIYKRFSDLL